MINFEIQQEPRVNDVIAAVVPQGDGCRNTRLVIIKIEGDIVIACEPSQDGDTIKLNTPRKYRIPRKRLSPEHRWREWQVGHMLD